MTVYYSAETTGPLNTTPAAMANGAIYGAKMRVYRATITLNAQTTSDTIVLASIPAGSVFKYGMHQSTDSLGSSTVAIGITGSTGKYRTAGTFTATNTPTPFGNVAAMSSALTAAETIFITIAAATMPSSGTYIVDLYFSQA